MKGIIENIFIDFQRMILKRIVAVTAKFIVLGPVAFFPLFYKNCLFFPSSDLQIIIIKNSM